MQENAHSDPLPRAAHGFFRLTPALWLGALALTCLVLPRLAEEIRYATVRGEMRARHDATNAEIDELTDSSRLLPLSDTSRAFRLVASKVAPSVVHLDTEQPVTSDKLSPTETLPRRIPPSLNHFRSQGQGSGVIVDPAGYIITNMHVIDKASRIIVKLADGRLIENVAVVGFDELTDLAVLKIDAPDLIPAEWGSSAELQVGDWVLAVGNPYGLDHSVTSGIVSAKERVRLSQAAALQNPQFSPHQAFLQTDAAVNPGNSGGPLLNVRGELVGITTAIVGRSFQGISFAVPSEVARETYERIRERGRMARGWLGVQFADDALRPRDTGALVGTVVPDSPAEDAGLKAGDLILEWNNQAVRDHIDLTLQVAATPVASTVTLVYERIGARLGTQVQVGDRPPEVEMRRRAFGILPQTEAE